MMFRHTVYCLSRGLRFSIAAIAWTVVSSAAVAQSPVPAGEQFDRMFRQFSKPMERFMPGMFSEVTPEQLAKLETVSISPSEEANFGKQVLRSYEQQLQQGGTSVLRRGPDVEYLQKLVNHVRPQMKHASRYPRIRIGVVDLETPDAYSIPGGDLLFTTGLLETAGSEAALLGVVAHELSHLDRGHQLYALKQTKRAQNALDFRNMMSAVAAVAKPFHAEFESQADSDAFGWLLAVGYDPRELARMLDRWNQQQDQRQPWMDMMPTFIRSHPDAGRRAGELLQRFDQLPAQKRPLVIGIENLETRKPHFAS